MRVHVCVCMHIKGWHKSKGFRKATRDSRFFEAEEYEYSISLQYIQESLEEAKTHMQFLPYQLGLSICLPVISCQNNCSLESANLRICGLPE